MTEALDMAVGGVLALVAWILPRHVANARAVLTPTLALDLFPVLLAGSLLLSATGRPLFTGLLLASLGAGFALADRTKRAVLREPVVFSEMSELRHVFTHPHLYLPFAGPALVLSGAMSFSELGVLIAIGIFVAALFMCSILFLFVRERSRNSGTRDWLFDLVARYVRGIARRPVPMLMFSCAVLLLLTAIGFSPVPPLQFEASARSLQPKKIRANQAL